MVGIHCRCGADILEIPLTDRVLDRGEIGILADALLRRAEYKPMIDLDAGVLDFPSQPSLDMLLIFAPHFLTVLAPWSGFIRIACDRLRRNIEVERAGLRLLDPSTFNHNTIIYDHRQTRTPCHFMN